MTEKRICAECGSELLAEIAEGMCPKCLLKVGLESGQGSRAAPGPEETTPPNSGFVPPEPAGLAKHFPQLEIQELLGHGGMGAVYKARQRDLDRVVAVKVLPPEVGRDPAFAERFSREARALAKLNHPNIVTVHDVGQSDGLYYFIMEYVDGVNLRETILSHRLNPQETLAIVPQICEALQYAHDQGVVHRDVKPENILLDRHGRVKIADFGLAKLMGRERSDFALTGTQQVMGTLRYMAPEQMEGSHAVDHRADIYSLGVVFYELLTGELPMGRFASPSQKVQLDVRLDEVVLRALEKEPERRYQQVSEVKTAVESIASAPGTALSADEPPRSVDAKKVWKGRVALMLVVIAAGVAGALGTPTHFSSIIWAGVLLWLGAWFAADAFRHRQTPRAWTSVFCLLAGVAAALVYIFAVPGPVLDLLYKAAGVEPAHDDIGGARLLCLMAIAGVITLMVKVRRQMTRTRVDERAR